MPNKGRKTFDVQPRDELHYITVVDDPQASVFDRQAKTARRKSPNEHQLLGILADVYETSGPGQTWPEFADVQIA